MSGISIDFSYCIIKLPLFFTFSSPPPGLPSGPSNIYIYIILGLESLDDLLTNLVRTSRVLTGNDVTSDDNLLGPRLIGLDVLATAGLIQLRLEHKGHKLAELDLVLLGVAEPGHLAALQQVGPVAERHVDEGGGAVADGRDDFALLGKGGRQLLGGGVGGEVVHGTVAAGEEDGIVALGRLGGDEVGQGAGGLPEVLVAVQEGDAALVGLEQLDRGWVQWGDAALGGREGEFGTGLYEGIVRVGELGLLIWGKKDEMLVLCSNFFMFIYFF